MYTKERKRIACVIPPYYRLIESKNNRLTPAMHYIAEIIHRRGHEVIFINGDFSKDDYADRVSITMNSWMFEERLKNGHKSFEEVIDILKEFKPDMVFIGAGDVLIPTVEIGSGQACDYLSKKIKSTFGSDITCIGYGHLLKYAKNKDLENLDIILFNEAENNVVDIVENNFSGEVTTSFLKDLDELPILSDSYIYHKVLPQDWDYIMSTRGCLNRCTFCYQPSLRGCDIAMMSPKRFVKEIRHRIEKYNIVSFYFADTVFISNGDKRTNEMIDRLIEVKKEYPEFNWRAEARIDSIDYELLPKIKEAGCKHLKFGVEMMNQDMLNVVKKGINIDEVKKVFKITKELGFERTAYVLLGCEGFSDKDYYGMWMDFKNLKADNYVININIPYMGTELYKSQSYKLKEHGIYKEGEEGFIHTSLAMKEFWGISDKTLNEFLSLEGEKDDSQHRDYKRKIVDKTYYMKTREVKYLSNE